jgi:hypothetical protein
LKPYYDNDGIKIYCGDCRTLLPSFPNQQWTVVTDPPYGIGFVHGAENIPHASKFSGVACAGDDEPFNPCHILEYKRVLMWGANHYAHKLPVPEGRWLVWDKRCGVTGDRDMADCEFAWVRGSKGQAARMFRHFWDGFNRQSERGIPRSHPMQKPEALMGWCLNFLPSGTVLDPYCGVGTTLVAAKRSGREAVGVEIEERYCEIAATRLSQGVLDLQAERTHVFSELMGTAMRDADEDAERVLRGESLP